MRKKNSNLFCPICDERYEKEEKYKFCNVRTRHHIFCSLWYGKIGVKLTACSKCHTYGFHKMFPMGTRIWTRYECIQKWVRFCKSRGKDAYAIYPELIELETLYQ